jgi:hypothetical protein
VSEAIPKLNQDFRDFLIEAKQHGYGSSDAKQSTAKSGAKQIEYERGLFLYVDNYAGGNPYAGFEHVAANVDGVYLPIWGMSYYETHKHPDATDQELTDVLGQVLVQPDPRLPIRGPRRWENSGVTYTMTSDDNLEKFEAEEWIAREIDERIKRVIYTAKFMGGLVNLDFVKKGKAFWLDNTDETS